MRFETSPGWNNTEFIPLKGEDWLTKQQLAGKAVATCLKTCKDIIESNSGYTLKELEADCMVILNRFNCTPTFKDYKGFPGAICTSVNKQVVHGIPTNYKIKEGDLVTVDLGATFEGAIADAAITAIAGTAKDPEHERLLKICKEALDKAIASIEIGKNLGCIGSTIHQHTRSSGFKLITLYGGHGIDWNKPHSSPFVPNKAYKHDGIRIQPGLAIAIEPMLTIGSNKTKTLDDGWTVVTAGINCHWEHSVFIGEDKVHIITDWENII